MYYKEYPNVYAFVGMVSLAVSVIYLVMSILYPRPVHIPVQKVQTYVGVVVSFIQGYGALQVLKAKLSK